MEWFWITLIFLTMLEMFIVGCIVIYYGNKILQQDNKEDNKEDHKKPKEKRSCDNCELVRSAFREGEQEGEVQTLETANRFLHDWSIESKKREKELFNKLCGKIIHEHNIKKINGADFINVYVILDVIKEHANKYGIIVDLEELE